MKYWDGDVNWYSPTELGSYIYAYSSKKKITELGLKNSSAKLLPPNKTIMFSSRASIGDIAILKEYGSTNQGIQSLVLNNKINIYFVFSMGNIITKKANKRATGSTFLEISRVALSNIQVLMPKFEEQNGIGNFFKIINHLITLHQCEHSMVILYYFSFDLVLIINA